MSQRGARLRFLESVSGVEQHGQLAAERVRSGDAEQLLGSGVPGGYEAVAVVEHCRGERVLEGGGAGPGRSLRRSRRAARRSRILQQAGEQPERVSQPGAHLIGAAVLALDPAQQAAQAGRRLAVRAQAFLDVPAKALVHAHGWSSCRAVAGGER